MKTRRSPPPGPRTRPSPGLKAAASTTPGAPAIGSSPAASYAIFALLLMDAVIVWAVFLSYTHIRLEDALITFRYAENLALGRGFVFNPGERVLGTTTPLFTLLLALFGRIFGTGSIPVWATVFGFVAMGGTAFYTSRALEALGAAPRFALVAAALLLFEPDMIWITCGGMETPLVLLFMAASLDFAIRGRWKLAAGAAALLVLTRVDGALWALLLLGTGCVRAPRSMPGALAVAAAILVPWVTFAWVYFGSPLPHAMIAKLVVGQSHGEPIRYFNWFMDSLGVARAAGPHHATFWMWVVLMALGVALAVRERRLLLVVVGFAPLFCLALWLGRSPRSFEWYLMPLTWACVVVGATGIELVARAAFGRGGRGLSSAVLLVILGALAVQDWNEGREVARIERDWQQNEIGLRRAVGEWLAAETPRDARVAMEAIGYQGVYSQRRIYDLGGIISPQAVQITRARHSNAEVFATTLDQIKPDYLVLRSFEVDRNASFHGGRLFETQEQFEAFARHYEEVRRFTAPVPRLWGPMSQLTVYRRRTPASQ
jgi:hypothetical protein